MMRHKHYFQNPLDLLSRQYMNASWVCPTFWCRLAEWCVWDAPRRSAIPAAWRRHPLVHLAVCLMNGQAAGMAARCQPPYSGSGDRLGPKPHGVPGLA